MVSRRGDRDSHAIDVRVRRLLRDYGWPLLGVLCLVVMLVGAMLTLLFVP